MKPKKRINEILEIPKEVYTNEPHIVLNSFEQMIIENYKGILEYEDFFVKISTYIGNININGFNLKLENMSEDDIKINGKIESLDIERKIDD